MVPYLAPSENGARAGVRWAAFVDESGHGLAVAAPAQGETFLFSAHRCTPFDPPPPPFPVLTGQVSSLPSY